MWTIGLYMRLSCGDEGTGESLSIANQRDLLYNYVKSRREFDGCPVLEFSDDGYSGVNFERPGIRELLSLAGKTVDCIIVKDFSRFGRNLVEVGDYLDQIFPFLGVRFIAVNEGYDSRDSFGRSASLGVSLQAMVYEMYSRDLSEKIRSVMRAKMRKGEYLCNIAFYGYRRSETEKNRLEVDPDAAEVVRRMFRMAAGGMTFAQIAVELNREEVPSPLMYRRAKHTDKSRSWHICGDIVYWTGNIVGRIIRDERYTGCLVGHKRVVADLSTRRTRPVPEEEWIVAENTHEALVTKEMFVQAQRVMRRSPEKKPRRKPYQKFRGLLKCAYCGRTLEHRICRQAYFLCPTAKTVQGVPCKAIHLEENVLEKALLMEIQAQTHSMSEEAPGEDIGDCLREEMKSCQLAISRYKTLLTDLFEDYAEERIDKHEYLLKKQEIARKQEETNRRFDELAKQLAQMHGGTENSSENLRRYSSVEELTREMLVELVKEIRVSGKDNLEIVWNFQDSSSKNDEKKL